jgi:hypothetical protein
VAVEHGLELSCGLGEVEMRLLDLFCGRWGIGRVFAARGHEVVGVDLVKPPDTPKGCIFIALNVLDLWMSQGWAHINSEFACHWSEPFDFVWASSPCDEFSKCGMPHMFPTAPYPELGIKLFNHTRRICEASRLPYVMENVRSAQRFVGNAVNHCGPFYLWGSGVPPLVNQGIVKGIGFPRDKATGKRALTPYRKTGSKSFKARAELKAQYATIPIELANCVADYAERLLEQRRDAVRI